MFVTFTANFLNFVYRNDCLTDINKTTTEFIFQYEGNIEVSVCDIKMSLIPVT